MRRIRRHHPRTSPRRDPVPWAGRSQAADRVRRFHPHPAGDRSPAVARREVDRLRRHGHGQRGQPLHERHLDRPGPGRRAAPPDDEPGLGHSAALVAGRKEDRLRLDPERIAPDLDDRSERRRGRPADDPLDGRLGRHVVAATAGSWPSPRRSIPTPPTTRRIRRRPRPPRRARSRPGSTRRSSSATGTPGATARAAMSSSCPRRAESRSTSRPAISTRRPSTSAERRTTPSRPTEPSSPSSGTSIPSSRKASGRTTTCSSFRPREASRGRSRPTRPTTTSRSIRPTGNTSPTGPWPGRDTSPTRKILTLYDRKTGAIRALTDAVDVSVAEMFWIPDGSALYFSADEKGRNALYKVLVAGGEAGEGPRRRDVRGDVAPARRRSRSSS